MINKIIKLLVNPQGALVQVLLEQFAKIFKSEKVLKYVEMENELDIAVGELKKENESLKFKVNAQVDLLKDLQDQIKGINSAVGLFSGIVKKLKKFPLLKSVLK